MKTSVCIALLFHPCGAFVPHFSAVSTATTAKTAAKARLPATCAARAEPDRHSPLRPLAHRRQHLGRGDPARDFSPGKYLVCFNDVHACADKCGHWFVSRAAHNMTCYCCDLHLDRSSCDGPSAVCSCCLRSCAIAVLISQLHATTACAPPMFPSPLPFPSLCGKGKRSQHLTYKYNYCIKYSYCSSAGHHVQTFNNELTSQQFRSSC